jgi:hypothetical protein
MRAGLRAGVIVRRESARVTPTFRKKLQLGRVQRSRLNDPVSELVRDIFGSPGVLQLKVLQALHLLGIQPAKLPTPAIVRHLAHADLADCVHYLLALRD